MAYTTWRDRPEPRPRRRRRLPAGWPAGTRTGGGGDGGGDGGGKGGEGGGKGGGWPSTAASMPRPAPSQAWRAGAAEEVLPVQGDYDLCETPQAQQGARLVARLPREEDVTFALGSRGMRMEKGRGAAAAGQPLYIRAGMLRDQPLAAT